MSVIDKTEMFRNIQIQTQIDREDAKLHYLGDLSVVEINILCHQLRNGMYDGHMFDKHDVPELEELIRDLI